jgi:hypothetical protein
VSFPKIGRNPLNTEKAAALKVADDLAAKSRMLRRAYQSEQEAMSAAIDAMKGITAEQQAEHVHAKEQIQNDAREAFAPLIALAQEKIRENDAVDREARPLIESLDGVNRKAVIERFSPHHGVTFLDQVKEHSAMDASKVSLANTRDRLAMLFRLVDEAKELLAGNMKDLAQAIETAESVADVQSGHGVMTMNTIKRYTRFAGDRAVILRSKVGAIKRTLKEIGQNILSQGTPAEADPNAREFVQTSVLLESQDVNAFRNSLSDTIHGTDSTEEAK